MKPGILPAWFLLACQPAIDPDGVPKGVGVDPRGSVGRIDVSQAPEGPGGDARAGDHVLLSGRGVQFVVEQVHHAVGFHGSGGNLIDIRVGDLPDVFGGMGSWLDRTFPRQAVYTRVEGGKRTVRAWGQDDGDARIAVQTSWILLAPRSPAILGRLLVRTEVTLGPGEPVPDYEIGDIVGWGGLRAWAPGRGFDLVGFDGPLPWVGGEGGGYAVLIVARTPLTGPHGAAWTDPVWLTTRLEPGRPVVVEREIVVGRTLAEIAEAACQIQDLPCVPSPGVVRERDVVGVRDAEVVISRIEGAEASPYLTGTVEGVTASLRPVLPAGRYRVTARSPTRPMLRAAEIVVDPASRGGPPLWTVEMGGSGRLTLSASGPDVALLPARFDLRGMAGTPDPDFGSDARAVGRNRVYSLGNTTIDLPPGRYEVTSSHGPAWSLDTQVVEVAATLPEVDPTKLLAHLRPVLPTSDLRSCDLHLHSAWSADSAVPPRDSVIAALAEGLDCIATTEHDVVADWTTTLAATPGGPDLLWLSGIEVTSRDQGHWNVYPWAPSLGIVLHRGQRPRGILEQIRSLAPAAVVQVNHPRYGRDGMFEVLRLGPDGRFQDAAAASDDFDAVEVINGKHTKEAEAVLQDWQQLLERGLVTTLVGASDSHRLVGQERGVARTWVRTRGDGGRDDVVAGLRQRRETVATTGPLLRWSENGRVLTVLRPDWMPLDEVELRHVQSTGTTTLLRAKVGDSTIEERRLEGRIEWRLSLPEKSDGTLVAIVRSDAPMTPWMDCPAWAVSARP